MVRDSLLALGLSSTEAAVYLAVLERGRAAATTIARQTGIKRTTVYMAGKSLVQKGVLQEDISGTTRYYIAEPQGIERYVLKQKRALKQQEERVAALLPELARIPKTKEGISIPRVRFVDQFELESFLYERAPLWDQSMLDTNQPCFWGFQDHSFVEEKKYRSWIEWQWQHSPKEINLQMFTNASKIEKKTMAQKDLSQRHIKLWEGKEVFTATQWVMGEYIANVITHEKPHYLVEIRDRLLADNLRNLYKHLWQQKEK